MQPNPVLARLGFDPHDRVVIIHIDDIGMSQASVDAFADVIEAGLASSGAVMSPCPWFPAAAAYARAHPQVDIGAHLTFNSEYETVRWGPISTHDPASGLLDEEGYFFRSREDAQKHANPEAVGREMSAQIERAVKAGISLTHADTHMGTVGHPKFIAHYVQVGMQHHLPVMVPRSDEEGFRRLGLDPEAASLGARLIMELESIGLPLLDGIATVHLDQPDNRLELLEESFACLPAGITHFYLHPAKDTPELRAMTPSWRARVGDYQALCDERLHKSVRDLGIQVIGYRPLKELMPGG